MYIKITNISKSVDSIQVYPTLAINISWSYV